MLLFSLLFIVVSGCTYLTENPRYQSAELRLSTTTSTCDTGLLDVLNKKFEEENGVKVLTLCQGTGKAIATGELGAADVVLVHAPDAEQKAVDRGSFINRTYLMYNSFLILGPENDPAGIKNATSAADAFKRIAASKINFISRGDDSGTHKKEKLLWKDAGITPQGEWYQSIGKGMGDTLITANIQQGYTLSDRGTYLAMKEKISLVPLFEKDSKLHNPYHVMAVNPEKFPEVNYELAVKYIEFLTSNSTQQLIRNYGRERFGEPLFIPAIRE
jgi:tungstate transport system substrate-binding protein